MTDHDPQTWGREERALSERLHRLAEHGAVTCVPRPLPPLSPSAAEVRPVRRLVPRATAVGALAAAALAVPVVLSGFVPGLPFAGDPVIATGPPAARAPLCDTVSTVAAPAGDRVVRPSASGQLQLQPTAQVPQLDAAQVRQRLTAAGLQFEPGTQLRYGSVDGTPAWTVTTCGTTGQGGSAAVLVTADEQGRITGRQQTAIEAVTEPTFVPVPRTPDGDPLMQVTPATADAQVVAQQPGTPNGGRTVMYRGADGSLCVLGGHGLPRTKAPVGTCASSLAQDNSFGVGASWADGDPRASLTGFAPTGTAWISIRQGDLPARELLVSAGDRAHGDHPGFSLSLDKRARVELVAYSSSGAEVGRFTQEFDGR